MNFKNLKKYIKKFKKNIVVYLTLLSLIFPCLPSLARAEQQDSFMIVPYECSSAYYQKTGERWRTADLDTRKQFYRAWRKVKIKEKKREQQINKQKNEELKRKVAEKKRKKQEEIKKLKQKALEKKKKIKAKKKKMKEFKKRIKANKRKMRDLKKKAARRRKAAIRKRRQMLRKR